MCAVGPDPKARGGGRNKVCARARARGAGVVRPPPPKEGEGVWERGSRDRPVPRGSSKHSDEDSPPAPQSGPGRKCFSNKLCPRDTHLKMISASRGIISSRTRTSGPLFALIGAGCFRCAVAIFVAIVKSSSDCIVVLHLTRSILCLQPMDLQPPLMTVK